MSYETVLGLITDAPAGFHPPHAEANLVRQIEINTALVLYQSLIQDGIINCDPERATFDQTTNRILKPSADAPIVGKIYRSPLYMDASMEVTGAVLSATTGNLTDSGLTGADAFWVNAYVIFTSGTYLGQVRRVTAYESSLHRLSWTAPLAGIPAAADTFVVTFFHVTGLTNSVLNYILARSGADTISRGIVEFHAVTTLVVPDGELYLSTATLNGSGVCTASDDGPFGCSRDLWTGMGASSVLSGSGTIEGLGAGLYVDVPVTHDELLNRGDLDVTADSTSVDVSVTEHHRTTEFTVRFTNEASYTLDFGYDWTRRGRMKAYPSNG
jgi:hypothetical protein